MLCLFGLWHFHQTPAFCSQLLTTSMWRFMHCKQPKIPYCSEPLSGRNCHYYWTRVFLYRQDFSVVGTMSGHSSWVLGVAFSADGQTFATCSADKSIRIWDLETKSCSHTFPDAHTDQIWSVVWGPKNKLASVGEDRAINIYTIMKWRGDRFLCCTKTSKVVIQIFVQGFPSTCIKF